MQAADAYYMLSRSLQAVVTLPIEDLVVLVDVTPVAQTVRVGDEVAELETRVRWADRHRSRLEVTGVLRGPSTWHHQRFEERLLIAVPTPPVTAMVRDVSS
jgi:hypothetical protein